jgi:hypothetical protein
MSRAIMTTLSTPLQADLLRELLDDAHRRVRELQAQVDHLSETLQRISLVDAAPSMDVLRDGCSNHPSELTLSSLRVPQSRQWLIFPHL